MTREEKLWTMRMQDLKAVADKLGIKINTKAAKSLAIEKILAAEEMNKQDNKETAKQEKVAEKTLKDQYTKKKEIVPEKIKTKNEFLNAVGDILDGKATVAPAPKLVPMPGTEDPNWGKKAAGEKPERKRGALIEYKGKAQNICAWAKELGVSANTLYGRIYKLGWPVEKAFEGK